LNHLPQAEEYQYSINVNSTTKGEEKTWTVEGTSGELPKKASDIVKDADPEDQTGMKFKLTAVTGTDQAAMLTLENDGTIRYTTTQIGNAIKDGIAKYNLEYNDDDKDGQGSVPITLFVNSDVAAMKNDYEPELTVTGKNGIGSSPEDGIYQKNTPVHIKLQLKKKDGSGYADKEMIGRLANKLSIIDQKTEEPAVGKTEFVQNEDALEYTVESTGNEAAVWIINADVGPFEGLTNTVRIENQYAPEAATEESITLNCSGDKVPGFLRSIIGQDTAEDDPIRLIQVSRLFSDQDNDQLEYSEPVFKTQDETGLMEPETITAVNLEDETSGKYLIKATGLPTSVFNDSYHCKLEITATDGDGQKATYVQEITVVDLYNKMITYLIIALIAIVVVVVVILIVRQIRKPKFPRLNMTIREEPSLYESGSQTLSEVKKPTNVNEIGVDSDMAAKHSIDLSLIQNIIIYPLRSTTSVGVCCKKPTTDHEIMLGDIEVKSKKKYTWALEQELSIRNLEGEGLVAIKLEDRQNEMSFDTGSQFGDDDNWSAVDQEQSLEAESRKHSWKVERKQAPAKEETVSNNNDDFDF